MKEYNENEFVKPEKPIPDLRKPSKYKLIRWLRWTWSGRISGCFVCTIEDRYSMKCPHCGKQYYHSFPGS